MIKRTISILLIIVIALLFAVQAASANVYLPIMPASDIRASAIGYGQAVTIDGGNWIDATCADGSLPLVQVDGISVIVLCEDR